MTLSVCIITFNEEANIGRTLASVQDLVRTLDGEIIVVDSGSTDRTREIAGSYGAKVFAEDWKGFAAQKNSAIVKATGEWVLLLDADEELSLELRTEITDLFYLTGTQRIQKLSTGAHYAWISRSDAGLRVDYDDQFEEELAGFDMPRRNLFLGKWIKRGGFWPDRKLRFFLRGSTQVEQRAVHETVLAKGRIVEFRGALIHHAYPTLSSYIEHMNRYSSLGAEMTGPRGFNLINIWLRPLLTFHYNYFLRLGFLDGKEGLLLHIYHAVYVSWKYAKAWELSRKSRTAELPR